MLSQQSDRNKPRTHFNSHYTRMTRKNGHEMNGLLIVYLIVLVSSEKHIIDSKMGAGRASAFVHILEVSLMLSQFTKEKEHTTSDLRIIEKGMPFLMNSYKATINRNDGMGMKIQKFHLVMHFCHNIKKFGSMKNFCSMIGEMLHKTEQKDPSYNTQRTESNFEEQTGNHYVENLKIMRSVYNEIEIQQDPFDYRPLYEQNNVVKENTNESHIKLRKKMWYDFQNNCLMKQKRRSRKFENVFLKDNVFQQQLELVCRNLIENNRIEEGDIDLYASCKKDNIIFRGDPNYETDSVWYDWANVKWSGISNETVPAKILTFIDLRTSFKKRFIVGTSEVNYPGIYAVAYTLPTNPAKRSAHEISRLCRYGRLMKNNNDEFDMIMFNVNSIESPQIAVPYRTDETNITSEEWLFLETRSNWYKILIETLKEGISEYEKKIQELENEETESSDDENENNQNTESKKKRKNEEKTEYQNKKRHK